MGMKSPQSFVETIPNYSGIFTKNKRVGAIINKNNNHWLFLGILPQAPDNAIILYDSVFMRDGYDQYVSSINTFIQWERQKAGLPRSVHHILSLA